MTFSFRPRSNASVASFAFAAFADFAAKFAMTGVLLVGLVSSGCEDKHIGRVCSLDAPDAGASGTGTAAVLNGSAVECPSRICLLPAEQKTATAGPLCTAGCSSDDDCDGETSSKNSAQCHSGFTCIVATTVGDFCCERLCVCKDFVDTSPMTPPYNALPASCLPGKSACKNVH